MTTIQSSRRNHPVAVAVFAVAYLAAMVFILMPQQVAQAIGADISIAARD